MNVPLKDPPTPAQRAAGARLKELRLRYGYGQGDISENHTEISNAENGRNLLRGVDLMNKYSAAFGLSAQDIQDLMAGRLTVAQAVARSSKPPPKEAPAPKKRGRGATKAPAPGESDALATLQKNVFGALISADIDMDKAEAERWSQGIVYALRGGQAFPSPNFIAERLRDLAKEFMEASRKADAGEDVLLDLGGKKVRVTSKKAKKRAS